MRIKVGDLRHIEDLYLKGEISYSRQVEMLNEIANQPDTHYVESILPTEEEIREYANGYFGYPEDVNSCVDAEVSAFADGAEWAIRLIKSRLAGKEEQK